MKTLNQSHRSQWLLPTLHDKYKMLLGTNTYATPGLTFEKYGFDERYETKANYVAMYSPIVFCDRAKTEFKQYLNLGVKHREKQLSSVVSKWFSAYFKIIITEKRNGMVEILDIMDEIQARWDKHLSNMPLQIFNRAYKYIKNETQTRKFASLVTCYAYLDMGSVMCETYLRIKNDGEYILIQQSMSHLIDELFGHLVGFKQLFSEIKELYTPATSIVFQKLKETVNNYKQ